MLCVSCKTDKPYTEFSFRNKAENIRSKSCKSCQKKWKDKHYQNNKKCYLEQNKKSRKEFRVWFNEYKSGLKCSKCPENHPATLDFHHRDPKQKDFTISGTGTSIGRKKLLKEIKKCDILCSNCHRKWHWEQTQVLTT